jgi:hypothetical protein
MKQHFLRLALLLAALLVFPGCAHGDSRPAAPRRKAIVFMMDGTRADALFNLDMPTLRKLAEGKWQPGYQGAWSLQARTIDDAYTGSAPNHSSIATGVTATKHRVFKNGQTKNGDYDKWPTWQERYLAAHPDRKAVFGYSWLESGLIGHSKAVIKCDSGKDGQDDPNVPRLRPYLTAEDCPDAIMIYIDAPDGGGHYTGFYPYGGFYLCNNFHTDELIGGYLDMIASRKAFASEDWLVIVTSDHGGYGKTHGISGGQCETIPFIIAGRHIVPGMLPGIPRNYDAPVTALDHLGIDVSKLPLDGKVIGKAPAATPKALPPREGLVLYANWNGVAANAVKDSPFAPVQVGADKISGGGRANAFYGATAVFPGGVLGQMTPDVKGKDGKVQKGRLITAAGIVLKGTEKLPLKDGRGFTVAFWAMLPEAQPGDTVLLGNKAAGAPAEEPGFVLVTSRKTERVKTPGVCLQYLQGKTPVTVGTFDVEPGKWTFYAVTCTDDGVLLCYQGSNDGHLYWIGGVADQASFANGKPWYLSQPEGDPNPANLQGAVEDFALWIRPLSFRELDAIYRGGRVGHPLQHLLK